ncbi:MAG: hypothetical protein IJQ85_01605 [Selenomonadaceae bacterium]|nr:hypothetical protein [Selenomonadaceae bacterium]
MEEFLQTLHERYGDISIGAIIGESFKIPPPINEPEIFSEPQDLNPFEQETPKNFSQWEFVIDTPPKTFSISPVNISSTKDWMTLRGEVLDIHELTNFFAGKMDFQSPKFRNILDAYRNAVEKNLGTPSEIDADSSTNFVDKLADIIQKRFFTILKSYKRGLQGKGENPTEYYQGLENRVKLYFKRIGLKSDNVQRLSNFRDSQERMKPTTVPTQNSYYDEKIAEVLVQPHYFEYYDDDGEIRKKWIDGECIVFKKN